MDKNQEKIDVKKIKIKEVVEVAEEDIRGLSDKEQRALASRLVSAANKRLKRRHERGIIDTTPKFSIRNRKNNDLIFEIERAKMYISLTERPRVSPQIGKILETPYQVWIKYNKKEMLKYVKILQRPVNKRLRDLKKAGIESPASTAMEDQGGYIKTEGKNLNLLRSEYARAVRFLQMKTSTVEGAKKWQKKSMDRINELYGFNIGTEFFDLLWKTYRKVKEFDETFKLREYKYKVLEEIDKIVIEKKGQKLTEDDVFQIILDRDILTDIYKSRIEKSRYGDTMAFDTSYVETNTDEDEDEYEE